MKNKWHIIDWTGRIMFDGKTFKTFDDAECFLCERLADDYEEERGEYTVIRA